jgi:hypothetical protein
LIAGKEVGGAAEEGTCEIDVELGEGYDEPELGGYAVDDTGGGGCFLLDKMLK